MNPADQAVVTLLARGVADVHGSAGLARLTELTGKRATKNTAAHALRRLQTQHIATRLALGDYRIEDEAFAGWMRRHQAESAKLKRARE